MTARVIHIANARKRDAGVAFDAHTEMIKVRTVLPDGREKTNVRVLKATVHIDVNSLAKRYRDPVEAAHAIIESDPEVDMEIIGRKLRRTRRLYVDKYDNIVYRANLYLSVMNPDGTEKDRRDLNRVPANVNSEKPLVWTGKMFPRAEAVRKFVFVRKYQIRHINGITYDFLYDMARELHEKDSIVLLGAGAKGTDPILLTRGGSPYRGFLEGRINGDRYCLILHLTDIELKGLQDETE